MDKRTLYALLAMLALFLVFDQFVWRPQARRKAQAQEQSRQAAAELPAELPTDSSDVSEAGQIAAVTSLDSLASSTASEETIRLQNELMQVSFSTRGAVITQVELNNYKINDEEQVKLINADSQIAGTTILSAGATKSLDTQVFAHTVAPDSASVTFYLGAQDSPTVAKTYSLDQSYGIKLDIKLQEVPGIIGLEHDFSSGIADSEEYLRSKAQDYKFLIYNAQLQKISVNSLKKKPPTSQISGFDWAAIRSKYFTIAVLENEPVITNDFSAFISKENASPAFKLISKQRQARNDWQQSFLIYAGPADYDILKAYGKSLENVAERGAAWLRWLAGIFAWLLKFLHKLIPNYGVVIIIFSILMKILLHPFTHKQMDASIKMQRIQPQVQAIQAQYKNDPKMMQMELSKLYKENGASPFSGCLPLLIQMPIFISLYNVLRYSLDMRNAGFIFWLKDLSEPDKFMVLPILMGVFMILQSRMMRPPVQDEANMDEKQKAMQSSQKMMTWMMPVMMFFIFRSMPAGLVLYWTVFNVLSIVQQYYLQKHFRTQEVTQ